MRSNRDWFDDEDDDWTDEYPENDDEPSETVLCPECGGEVYEDAVRCPVCGSYITQDTRVWSGRPRWWVLLGLLGIAAAIVGMVALAHW